MRAVKFTLLAATRLMPSISQPRVNISPAFVTVCGRASCSSVLSRVSLGGAPQEYVADRLQWQDGDAPTGVANLRHPGREAPFPGMEPLLEGLRGAGPHPGSRRSRWPRVMGPP